MSEAVTTPIVASIVVRMGDGTEHVIAECGQFKPGFVPVVYFVDGGAAGQDALLRIGDLIKCRVELRHVNLADSGPLPQFVSFNTEGAMKVSE